MSATTDYTVWAPFAAAAFFVLTAVGACTGWTLGGHSSITMTIDVYGHLFDGPEGDVAPFEKMERSLMAA